MDKIGTYAFPTYRTFKDALAIAQEAISKFGGVMPIADALKKLGYTVNPKAISGPLYRQIDDMCMYGLFTREIRGALKTTPLAVEALDPYDLNKASQGKIKALRGIELIARAFDAWNGQLPDDSALPAKLSELTGADWMESKAKSASVKIVINEAIAYLHMPTSLGTTIQPVDRGESQMKSQNQPISNPTNPVTPQTTRQFGAIEEYVLGNGIRVYLPKDDVKSAWEKTKKVLDLLINEPEKQKVEGKTDEAPLA